MRRVNRFLEQRIPSALTIAIVNWSFLALIFFLVRNPFELIHLRKAAASNVGEILLQSPFSAGILGLMSTTRLIQVSSDALVPIANPTSFGVLALISAGLGNFVVPSGGGQFAVQRPIMLDAANQLGVDPSIAITAVSCGDQWTNMLQPFWALPVLAIAGLKMRDIIGDTSVTFLGSGMVASMVGPIPSVGGSGNANVDMPFRCGTDCPVE